MDAHTELFSRLAPLVAILMLAGSFAPLISNVSAEGGGEDYPYSGTGDWIIDSDTYVYNETVVVNGNLIIQDGGKLTLRNTTIKMDVSSDGEFYIEVQDGGELHILDWDDDPTTTGDRSLITDGDGDNDGAAFNNNANHRYYLAVRPAAVFVMRNSELRESGYFYGDYAGIYLDGRADFVFENNTVAKCYRGINLIYSNGNAVRNNTFDACDAQGIIMYYSRNNIIENNTFKNCPNQGLYLWNNNQIADQTRDNIIRNNRMLDNEYGLYVLNKDSCYNTFENNHFDGNTNGATVTTGARHNTFENNYYTGNNYGITVTTNAHNNTFVGETIKNSGAYGLYVLSKSSYNVFEDTTLDGNKYGFITRYAAAQNVMINSSFTNTVNIDFFMFEGTNQTFINTEYRNRQVRAGAYLTEMEYVNVAVEDLRGDPIHDADIHIVSREVEVPDEPDNIVHTRHGTKASTNSELTWYQVAQRVMDGYGEDGSSIGYYWLTKNDPPAGTALTLDLTKPKTFDRVRFLNTRNANNHDRSTKDFRLGVSTDGTNFDIVQTGRLVEDDITTWYEVELPPTTAQYIRFYVDSYYGKGAGLAELEVYNTGDMKRVFDFDMYSSPGFGGNDRRTDTTGRVKAIPVIHKRYYGDNTEHLFETDISIRYHGWEQEQTGLVVSEETNIDFTKDILTVGPSGKDFTTIQAAVDYADPEKEVKVFTGNYQENVVIADKELDIYTATDNHNDTILGARGGTGFKVSGSKTVAIDGLVIKDAAEGVENQGHGHQYSNLSFENTTIPFQVGENSSLTTIDVQFDDSAVVFDDLAGRIYEKNSLEVYVHDLDDKPVPDVMVELRDRDNILVRNAMTRADGTTELMPLLHRVLVKESEDLHSPYTVTIMKGEGKDEAAVVMNVSQTVSLMWYEPTHFGGAMDIGDLDGDGVDDFAVGSPSYDGDEDNVGAVFLYKGDDQLVIDDLSPDNYDRVIYGERGNDRLGAALALGGDLNGDGYDDLVIGAPNTNLSVPYGINARYYHSQGENKFAMLVHEQQEQMIANYWGQGRPHPDVNVDNFGVRWRGFISIEESGNYTFFTNADDGVRFYLDEGLFIDEWTYTGEEYSTDPFYLEKGLYPFLVEYYEGSGASRMQLSWSSEHFEKQIVPPEAFRHTTKRGPGTGGVYIINGRDSLLYKNGGDTNGNGNGQTWKEMNLNLVASSSLDRDFGVHEFGKAMEYLGDMDGDGCDELGVLGSRSGHDDRDRLYLLHGTPISTHHEFRPLISGLPDEDEYRKNFTTLFARSEWELPVTGDEGLFNVSDEGYLDVDSSPGTSSYAYVVSSQGIGSGLDLSVKFKRGYGHGSFPVLGVMNYQLSESDVANDTKQDAATIFSLTTRGGVSMREEPGATPVEGQGRNLGSYPVARVVVTPEHDNITVYLNGKVIMSMDVHGWDDDLYILIGDSRSNDDQGTASLVWLKPCPYSEHLNTNTTLLSFGSGQIMGDERQELVVSAYDTLLFKSNGKNILTALDNETELFGGGDFERTIYENGTLQIVREIPDYIPNGNFDRGWNNWSFIKNRQNQKNAYARLLEEAVGDWKLSPLSGSPTGGYGISGNSLDALNGQSTGKLRTEAFPIIDGLDEITLWRRWAVMSFDTNEGMSIKLYRASDHTELLTFDAWTAPSDSLNYEVEGELSASVAGLVGETVYLAMETIGGDGPYDDGLFQIDDVQAIASFTTGNFVSEFIPVEDGSQALIPQWNEEPSQGTVVMRFRTNESTEWENATVAENGGMLRLTEEATWFQYQFELVRDPDHVSPEVRELEFILFNETTMPLQANTSEEYRSLTGAVDGDGMDEFVLFSGQQGEVVVIDGAVLEAALVGGEAYLDMENYLMRFEPDAGEEHREFGKQASIVPDIDGDGLQDILVSDPTTRGTVTGGGAVYAFYGADVKTDYVLADAAFEFRGEIKSGSLGTKMRRNLVSLPNTITPRVEVLPFHLSDVAITRVNVRNDSLIYPGTTLNFSMAAANTGFHQATTIDYYINITSEDGSYSTTYQGQIGAIDPDSWETINASWEVPGVEERPYYMNLSLVMSGDMSSWNNERVIHVTSRYYKTRLDPDRSMDSKRPHEYLSYNVTITNIGTLGEDAVNLSAAVPAGWEYRFLHDGSEIDSLNVSDVETVEFLVRSPLDEPLAPEGYDFTINATSRNGITARYRDLKGYLVEVDIVPVAINLYRYDGVEIGTSRHLIEREGSLVEVELLNMGNLSSGSFNLSLYQDKELIETFLVSSVGAGEVLAFSTELVLDVGAVSFRAVVDEENRCLEYTETNNRVTRSTTVIDSAPDNDYRVYGTIYDLDANPVEGAELRVTVLGYSYDFVAETDEHGQAEILLSAIDPDEYHEGARLRIEGIKGSKYAYFVDYAYSEDSETHVSLVLMKYSLDVQVDSLTKTMKLNDEKNAYLPVDYRMNITNSGVESEIYELYVGKPFGWRFDLVGNVTDRGAGKYGLVLEAKSSEEITLQVTNNDRMDSPGGKRHSGNMGVNFTLSVAAESSPFSVVRTLTTIIAPEDNLIIDALNTDGKLYEKNGRFYKNLTAGTVSTYTVNLINYGNTNKRFYLINEGVHAEYATIDTTSLVIDCLSSHIYRAEFEVTLTVPEYLREGEEFHVDILLIDENNTFSDNVPLSVLALKRRDVDVDATAASSLGKNQTLVYLEFMNPTADELFLGLDSASFANPAHHGSFILPEDGVTLGAGESGIIGLTVLLDNMNQTSVGEPIGIELRVDIDNGTFLDKQLSYPAQDYHELSLTTESRGRSFHQGETQVYTLILGNHGNDDFDIASFGVDDPAGWGVDMNAVIIRKDEELSFSFRVTAPPDADNGARNDITITPYSRNGEAQVPLVLTNTIESEARALSMSYFEHVSGDGVVNYTLRIRNDGTFDETLRAELTIPGEYSYTMIPERFLVHEGQSKYISFVVDTPGEGFAFSNYTVQLYTEDGEVPLSEFTLPGIPVSGITMDHNAGNYTFTASSDYEGTAGFLWEINQGMIPLTNEDEVSPSFTMEFEKAGVYTITLRTTVYDELIGTLTDSSSMTLTIENQKPDLSKMPGELAVEVNETLVIDSADVVDVDGTVVDVMFSYNNTTIHATKFTTSFTEPGEYIITIIVVDNQGAVTEKEVRVVVTPREAVSTSDEKHMLSQSSTISIWGLAGILLVAAGLLVSYLKKLEDAETDSLARLEELSSLKKEKEKERDLLESREKEDKEKEP